VESRPSAPVQLTGQSAALVGWQFLRDPLVALRTVHAAHGRFVILSDPLPLIKFRKVVALTVGPAFNRAVLGDPASWRTVSVGFTGPKNSAARRLTLGIVRMNGPQHAHYRRLLVPPLRESSIEPLGDEMARLAEAEVETWPVDEPLDLWACVRRLMRTFAIGLLFGDDRKNGYPIADGISSGLDNNWSMRVVACPINLPFTPYGKMLRAAERFERSVLDWAVTKRARFDERDLLSIIVNNPDETGKPPSDATIAGHVPTLFAAAYETCQNVLVWILILLAQHPRVSHDLLDELQGALAGAGPTLRTVGKLPLLDAVVRETMRILPPVPLQSRVATRDTTLMGYPARKGLRIILNNFLINRLPDLYTAPDRFRPERWNTINPTPFEYAVFSAGPRSCPGYSFGLSVVKVAVATILTRFRIALAHRSRIDYKVRLALSPRGGIPATLHRQDGAFTATRIDGSLCKLVRFPDDGCDG